MAGNRLGLYISKQLANSLGGDLMLETTGNTGTTFHFSLNNQHKHPGQAMPWERYAMEEIDREMYEEFKVKLGKNVQLWLKNWQRWLDGCRTLKNV